MISKLTDAERYGVALRLAREATGLSLGQAARILGMRVSELSDLELHGKVRLPVPPETSE